MRIVHTSLAQLQNIEGTLGKKAYGQTPHALAADLRPEY